MQVRFGSRWIASGLAAALGSLALATGASAATITTTTTADEDGAENNQCSLREALASAAANGNVGGCGSQGAFGNDTVRVAPGTYTLTEGALNPAGAGDVTIQNAGGGAAIVDANDASRVFNTGEEMTIDGLVLQNGRDSAGAIINYAGDELTIRNSTLRGGEATSFNGGAMQVIQGAGETLTIENSTFTGNRAQDDGGALWVNGAGDTNLRNVTIAGNTADSNNAGGGQGGGFFFGNGGGDTILSNTIVAGNSVGASGISPNCSGVFDSAGNNLFGANGNQDCFGATGNDQENADPKLGPLADNGGLTPTFALAANSPALNKGTDCLPTDQRGVARFLGGSCDIGAYERVECEGQAATRVGTEDSETLTGTEGNDVFLMLGGHDIAIGLGGNDLACGGDGDDVLDGGDGDDRFGGDAGEDTLAGGDGDDRFQGDDGDDVAKGGAGNDNTAGGAGKDNLSGQAGNDKLNGGAGKDRIKGGAGKDRLIGSGGKDNCAGGGGKDKAAGCEREKSI